MSTKQVVKEEIKAVTGNMAAAHAARLARVNTGIFFPIGPVDEVMENFQEMIDRGEAEGAEILQLQNERGCVSAQYALAGLGIRTMFVTTAGGLIWPACMIKTATGARFPLMIVVPSRSFAPPVGVGCDYQDFIMVRDIGALQLYCEDPQDILDTIIQGYKVSEDPKISLPIIVGYDGWDVSHSTSRISLPAQELVDEFLPPFALSKEADPLAVDWYEVSKDRRDFEWSPEWYMENRYKGAMAIQEAGRRIEEVGREFRELFGRKNVGLIEADHCDGAEVVILTMGGVTATARLVANIFREEGSKVGVLKLRSFRPFPENAIREALAGVKAVVTVERDMSAAIYDEVRKSLYGMKDAPKVLGRIAGLGGREVSYYDLAANVEEGLKAARGEDVEEFKWNLWLE